MIDIKKIVRGSGYAIEESNFDTTNILCRYGHIYADGQWLIAAMQNATKTQSRQLRRLGEVIADGDFGELSVRFLVSRLSDVVRILRPRQKSLLAVG